MRATDESPSWEHPFAQLREAVQRKPSAWLEQLRASASLADPLLLARIPAEHRKLTAAGVPHVLPLSGLERDGDRLVLVHRHERGESLAQRLAGGPLPLARALVLLREICKTLAAAHRVGIEHRALGPASVLLGTHDDELWLLDFGIADLFVREGKPPRQPVGTDELDPYDVALFPMTPERGTGRPGSASEDVYLVGCLAHWMIAGLPPFGAVDLDELARRHASEPPRPLTELVATPLPFSLIDAVARALHKDPEQRYADIEALDRVLAQAQSEAGMAPAEVPRTPGLPPRQTNPFGTDPPRPVLRDAADDEPERMAPTMVIDEKMRAALPAAPRLRADGSMTAPLPVLPPSSGRHARWGIATGVLGIVAALVIVAWPTEPPQRQWSATAGRRANDDAPRSDAIPTVSEPMAVAEPRVARAAVVPEPSEPVVAAEAPAPAVEPVVHEPTTQHDDPVDEAAAADEVASAVVPAPTTLAVVTPSRTEPTPRERPQARSSARAQVDASAAPAVAPKHESSECADVRKAANDARGAYEWSALLVAASRAECWRSRGEAHALRIKALMELGRFAECASAVEKLRTRDAELVRVGELCRRRAEPTG